jgi:Putative Flp pilus-assembly TadE/G-like
MIRTIEAVLRIAQRPFSLAQRGQNGQVLILAAGSFAVVLFFASLAIDIGFFTEAKRSAQNDADAMALAAARELTTDGFTEAQRHEDAEDIAMEWALRNDVDPSEVQDIAFDVSCSGEAVTRAVTVRLKRTQKTFLATTFGINSGQLNVCATARTGLAMGGPGLMPFGLLYDDPEIFANPPVCYFDDNPDFWDEECTIKIPKPNDTWTPGNSGPLRLDDPNATYTMEQDCITSDTTSGADEYVQNIEDGSDCAYVPMDEVKTKTGSMNNITCNSIANRLGGNNDPLSDVFTDSDGDGIYEVVDFTHPRYALIPVVIVAPGSSGSSTDVTIERFITAYLVGCQSGANNVANITLVPVQSDVYVAGIDFVDDGDPDYDENWPLHTIKLVE